MKKLLVLREIMLPELKLYFASRFPNMRSAHRTEFAARGLGYSTYASLLAAVRNGPLFIDAVDVERAIHFAEAIEVQVDPQEVRRAFFELLDLGNLGDT